MNALSLITNINALNAASTTQEIIEIITFDFKRLTPFENRHFTNWNYEEDCIMNWFRWREQNQTIPNWQDQYAPDNKYSSPTLKKLFQLLGWGEVRYTDTMVSFLTIYGFALFLYYPEAFTYDEKIHFIRVIDNGRMTPQIISERYLLGKSN